MCHILGIKHGVVNGTMLNVSDLLNNDYSLIGFAIDNLINMAFVILFLFLVILFVQIRLNFVNKRTSKVLVSTFSSTRLV